MLRPLNRPPPRRLAPRLLGTPRPPGQLVPAARLATNSPPAKTDDAQNTTGYQTQATPASDSAASVQKKTVAEQDEELRLKLEGMSGEGGAAGVEYENGKAEGLKRGVKSNMFRVI
ncbi:hypothetical protein CH063_05352 [Colletotrichum higginsianum]|uniref:Uncharacterized protein n=1 Tax=Colletotrichum higginsianum (strain IMI 349063) TaxID=759273 RepID=H1UYP4_COLHI|nr:hypothetical protein CH63R_05049 [Colletotrichum higginsianum IMI 349063]OBR12753.1 hypothetical protein CH63R_05049 [Colletotrichum higginsianum IMI 349063]GJC94426.1 hypothetical protein ColKHC_03252 [Colletotrichum higginsianum]CCF33095.1 hypothetical protein CH063_05352 [Colletotrichum higginsianum]